MADYISREALLKEFDELLQVARDNNEGWPWDEGQIYGLEKAIEDAKEIPSADVVERKKGKWIWEKNKPTTCSCCGYGFYSRDDFPFYCQNYGARMVSE